MRDRSFCFVEVMAVYDRLSAGKDQPMSVTCALDTLVRTEPTGQLRDRLALLDVPKPIWGLKPAETIGEESLSTAAWVFLYHPGSLIRITDKTDRNEVADFFSRVMEGSHAQ